MRFDFFDKNAVLFMWSTNTFLPDAIRVMSSWGFKYHCSIVWKKNNGITMRGFHRTVEFLLFGYNGKFPDIFRGKPFPCFVSADRLKHSEKPNIFRELIRDKFKGRAIELFARQRVEGWDAWGNEIEGSPVLGEDSPAQDTAEICHTAPNTPSMPLVKDAVESGL
jgi:site-specific DNA-methyltransferase (adenine-specific)